MRPFMDIIEECRQKQRQSQYEIDTNLLLKAKVDEVAVLFETVEELEAFIPYCHENGLEHIGSVAEDTLLDTTDGDPIGGDWFNVRFEFFRIPGRHWRIEAVTVLEGIERAPLHRSHLDEWGSGSIIHASWKETDFPAYQTRLLQLADLPLRKYLEYRNTYGVFSYWNSPDPFSVYLKPRVNLQDQR